MPFRRTTTNSRYVATRSAPAERFFVPVNTNWLLLCLRKQFLRGWIARFILESHTTPTHAPPSERSSTQLCMQSSMDEVFLPPESWPAPKLALQKTSKV